MPTYCVISQISIIFASSIKKNNIQVLFMRQKIVSILMLCMLVLTSCSNKDNVVDITGEKVKCVFTANTNAVIEETPMTRSTSPRMIKYHFASGDEVITGEIAEHTPLFIELNKNKSYQYKFFYADAINGNVATLLNEHMYSYKNVIQVEDAITENIKLTRCIGQFVAKAGKMPQGATLDVTLAYYNEWNWISDNPVQTQVNPITPSVNAILASDSTLSTYALAYPIIKTVAAHVSIIKNNHVIKKASYEYFIKPNVKHTVTYNINNVNEDGTEFGDYTISIDERWEEVEENDNQQVGK